MSQAQERPGILSVPSAFLHHPSPPQLKAEQPQQPVKLNARVEILGEEVCRVDFTVYLVQLEVSEPEPLLDPECMALDVP